MSSNIVHLSRLTEIADFTGEVVAMSDEGAEGTLDAIGYPTAADMARAVEITAEEVAIAAEEFLASAVVLELPVEDERVDALTPDQEAEIDRKVDQGVGSYDGARFRVVGS